MAGVWFCGRISLDKELEMGAFDEVAEGRCSTAQAGARLYNAPDDRSRISSGNNHL
jgi:hypothetical protein